MEPLSGPSPGPYDYDLLVIGGGSGGLAVAKEAAGLRKKVLILDLTAPSPRGTMRVLGGSSLNVDNVRKFLRHSALLGEAFLGSENFGWKTKERVSHGWMELMEAVKQQMKTRSEELRRELKRSGVFYLNARGEIVAPHTVEVTEMSGRKRQLTAETLVIATGERPQCLGIPGDKEFCITSQDLLSLPHPPGKTLVMGGSAEGLECAGFMVGLGMPVFVMLQPDLLPGSEKKIAQKIENFMMNNGVTFLYHCSLKKVEEFEDSASGHENAALHQASKKRIRVTFTNKDGQTKEEDFDTVILAVGKQACTDDIGLESVGVQCSQETGKILVSERDQTTVDHIYAIGSVQHGRPATTGLSVHAGMLLARRLYRGDSLLCDYTNVPSVVLTPLEYAACGLSEEKANLTFGEDNVEVYHNYYWPLEWELPARNKNSAYVQVVCHIPDKERVVGLHVLGPNAGDILQGFVAAMKCGLTKEQLDATVGIHPGSAQVLTSLTQTQRMSEALMMRGNC